jgi:hypothetical protein
VQLLANLVEGSVPDVAASGAATGIETGQHAVLARRSRGRPLQTDERYAIRRHSFLRMSTGRRKILSE